MHISPWLANEAMATACLSCDPLPVIRWLLQRGGSGGDGPSDPNLPGRRPVGWGADALQAAAIRGHLAVVLLLLDE